MLIKNNTEFNTVCLFNLYMYNQDHCSFAKNADLDLGLRAVLLAPFDQFIHRFTVSLKKVQTE